MAVDKASQRIVGTRAALSLEKIMTLKINDPNLGDLLNHFGKLEEMAAKNLPQIHPSKFSKGLQIGTD